MAYFNETGRNLNIHTSGGRMQKIGGCNFRAWPSLYVRLGVWILENTSGDSQYEPIIATYGPSSGWYLFWIRTDKTLRYFQAYFNTVVDVLQLQLAFPNPANTTYGPVVWELAWDLTIARAAFWFNGRLMGSIATTSNLDHVNFDNHNLYLGDDAYARWAIGYWDDVIITDSLPAHIATDLANSGSHFELPLTAAEHEATYGYTADHKWTFNADDGADTGSVGGWTLTPNDPAKLGYVNSVLLGELIDEVPPVCEVVLNCSYSPAQLPPGATFVFDSTLNGGSSPLDRLWEWSSDGGVNWNTAASVAASFTFDNTVHGDVPDEYWIRCTLSGDTSGIVKVTILEAAPTPPSAPTGLRVMEAPGKVEGLIATGGD